MRGKWVLISIAAVLLGVGGGAIWTRHRHSQAPAAGRGSGAAVIQNSEVTLSGKIRPQHLTGVGAPAGVEGNIEAFLVEVGQDVFEGQVLMRIGAAGLETARDNAANALDRAQNQANRAEGVLNNAMLEASRAEANADRARLALDRVDKAFSRQKTLLAAGATPKLAYQKVEEEYTAARTDFEIMDRALRAAREDVQSAQQQLASARKQVAERMSHLDVAQTAMASSEVRSPVDGTVAERNGEVGKPVGEVGKDLFQIATDLYALEVECDVPPPVLKRLRPGQQALVLVLDLQSAGLTGAVKSITGSQAIVEFNSNVPAVRPGMRADVRLKFD